MASGMNGVSMSNDSVVMEVGVQNLMKKLAIKKEHPNDASVIEPLEVMRSPTSIQDFQRKFSSSEGPENPTHSSKLHFLSESASMSESEEITSSNNGDHTNNQVGTVDVMVQNTLKKLQIKKNSANSSDTDYDHDTSGDIMRSKLSIQEFKNRFSSSSVHDTSVHDTSVHDTSVHDTSGDRMRSKISIQEFRNRFSSSSEQGKEGWNSLETTPRGKQNKYSTINGRQEIYPESGREVILLDNVGREISVHSKTDSNNHAENSLAEEQKS